MATGGRPGPPSFESDDEAIVVDPATVLEAERTGTIETLVGGDGLPDSVLIWDPIGDGVGVGIAELLAKTGRTITFCTPDPIAGTLLALSGDLAGANVRLQQAGVRIERRQRLIAVGPSSATMVHAFTAERARIETEAVVDCGSRLPEDSLAADSANPPGGPLIRVGDAVAARSVGEAIREGRAAALALDRRLEVAR